MLVYNRLFFLAFFLLVGCQLDEPSKPIANFSTSGDNCIGPCTVTFTNTSENTSVYNWVYSWDFGDGTSSKEKSPSHVYQVSGSFKVTLTMNGKYGMATDSTTVLIREKQADPPVPDFIIESINLLVDSAILFKNSSKNAVTFLWNFGDKSTDSVSTDPAPSHIYKTKGEYTVSLEATGPGGKEVKKTKINIKNPSVTADFSISEGTPVAAYIEISFENQSKHAIRYEWDFGDKTISTEKSPKHKYTRYDVDSTYVVGLRAIGADTATKTKSVKIKKK